MIFMILRGPQLDWFISRLDRRSQCYIEKLMKGNLKPKDEGYLFWKKRWYSWCSAHQEYSPSCLSCHIGAYENVVWLKIRKMWQRTIKFKQ